MTLNITNYGFLLFFSVYPGKISERSISEKIKQKEAVSLFDQ
jgi:hypothetical protein